MVETKIINEELSPLSETDIHNDDGSEILFHGRVRDEENGKKIVALDYEYYQPMAEKKLQSVGETAVQKFKIHKLLCIQRVGYVKVGEIALRVIIYSRHRKEGIKALDWFISELKNEVPIWKWGVTENGQRFPT